MKTSIFTLFFISFNYQQMKVFLCISTLRAKMYENIDEDVKKASKRKIMIMKWGKKNKL